MNPVSATEVHSQEQEQEQYLDSPPVTPTSTAIPTISLSPPVMKPLPPIPNDTALEQYSDEHQPIPSTRPPRYHIVSQNRNRRVAIPVSFPPYTDTEPTQDSPDDDDVPLALLCQYPTEAPPAYHIAVGHDFRDSLIMHIPVQTDNFTEIIGDEEARLGFGDDDLDENHPSHMVEMWTVRAVIWIGLLGILAFVGWQVALYNDLL